MNDSPKPAGAGAAAGAGADDEAQAALLDDLMRAMQNADTVRLANLLGEHPELKEWQGVLADLNALGAQAVNLESPSGLPQPPASGEGQPFGRYLLQAEIGRGGMGVVYRAWQPDLARPVAVKMILSSRLARPEEVRRFYAEARLTARVRHPHIVSIYEAGEDGGQHFYAMEYIEGISLDRHAAGRALDVEEACRLMAPVIRAVGHLHREGILHRDLKPANLLLDGQGKLHVADFGLATLLSSDQRHTLSGTVLGTPAYMPPEQAAGKIRELTPQADIYSLGAILYELLAGRPLYEDDSPARLLLQVIEREPQPVQRFNRNVPRSLWWVVRRSLEKTPEQRYQSADAFADDLERFLRGEPVEARSDAWSREIVRVARRHPPVTYRLMAIMAALAIVAARVAFHPETFEFYTPVLLAIVVWAALVVAWEAIWQRWPPGRERIATAMTLSDVVVLTYIMEITGSVDGPVMSLYHIVISAAGLSLRRRRVWIAVGASLAAYAFLLTNPPFPGALREPHLSVLFALSLVVCGAIAAYHAKRLSILQQGEEAPSTRSRPVGPGSGGGSI